MSIEQATWFMTVVSCAGWALLGFLVIREGRREMSQDVLDDGVIGFVACVALCCIILGLMMACGLVSYLSHLLALEAADPRAWHVVAGGP